MKQIILVGLGPGDPQALTLRSLQALQKAKKVYIRTARHPCVSMLEQYNIDYKALDFFYRKTTSFEETYRQIAFFVINAALQHGQVAYAVPGSPFFAEKTVEMILEKAPLAGVTCRTLPAVSFVEAIAAELGLPREKELVVQDALEPDKLLDNPDKHILIMQAYNRQIASSVKLHLTELYPDEHRITVIRGAGLAGNKQVVTIPLYELDRLGFIDHLTTIYVPPLAAYGIADLQQVMRRLRGEDGCPWDQEQDHHSLKPYLLEEAYEVIGAIDSGNHDDLREELGDLLLQVVFHCQIATENSSFAFHDVVAGITKKLVRRHPHVFGAGDAKNAEEVMRTWQEIKKEEKRGRDSLFTLENYLPALLRAQKLQRQASSVGFDWPDASGAWDKVEEELKELQDAYKQQQAAKIKEELGDLLFAVVNVARFLDVDAEQALAAATDKFFTRLRHVEKMALAEGGGIADHSMSKLDEWWNEAKKRPNG